MADPLKELVNRQTVLDLGARIQKVYRIFDVKGFTNRVVRTLDSLGLMERLSLIATALEDFLPPSFERSSRILVRSLGPELDDEADDPVATDLSSSRGFVVVALGLYVERLGLNHFEQSMHAFYEMTKRFSAEGPIRTFIIKREKDVLRQFDIWVKDPNVHVRRLVSESLRPRLPWAPRLPRFIKDPRPSVKYLEALKDDNHLYVRRSVANHLNDISKDHPDLVVSLAKRWAKKASPQRKWLIKHALRTLVKQGHPGALELMGSSSKISLDVKSFVLDRKKILLGEALSMKLDLRSRGRMEQFLIIDYAVYFQKANGKLSPKVFKWTQKSLLKGTPLLLEKRHVFRKITTRRYYGGKHRIDLQINGKVVARQEFNLVV